MQGNDIIYRHGPVFQAANIFFMNFFLAFFIGHDILILSLGGQEADEEKIFYSVYTNGYL